MCGIAGISLKDQGNRSDEIIKMTKSLKHRGPDGVGFACLSPFKTPLLSLGNFALNESGHVFLGHRRLSIIDLEGSNQPLSNEDGTIWTVFNGEIYNYIELRKLLLSKGHVLRNKGDTEVLVHLWEEYGKDMVDHLVGMFAFSIYDSARDVLFLTRDRFGQKPLYYFEKNNLFYFASELQAFFELDVFKTIGTNDIAIAQYFRYGFIPNPETVYKNVFTLPPGHSLVRSKGQTTLYQYWKPNVTGEVDSFDYDKLESLLDESVKLRLRSDVPFGAFLSGGVDSALITSSMVKFCSEPVKTFTISTGKEYFTDESEAAAETARIMKTDHHVFKVEPNFIDVAEKLARHYGQPYSDYSSILAYYVSAETRKHVKVALTGDGGDELFAGYNGYLRLNLYSRFGILPFPVKKAVGTLYGLFSASGTDFQRHDSICSAFPLPLKGENIAPLFHSLWRKSTLHPDFIMKVENIRAVEISRFTSYFEEAVSSNPLDRWMEADQRLYLCDDVLAKLDIASMSVSLECRSPLLDHRFAEFANRISAVKKTENGCAKSILKKIASRRNLSHLSDLPKKGFSMPFAQWLRQGAIKDWAYSLIFDNKSAWSCYLSENSVVRFWEDHQSGRMNHQMRLWMIASMALWQKSRKG